MVFRLIHTRLTGLVGGSPWSRDICMTESNSGCLRSPGFTPLWPGFGTRTRHRSYM